MSYDDDLSIRGQFEQRRMLRRLVAAAPVRLSTPQTPPHWACPVCEQPCYCIDPLARLAPHLACRGDAA